MQYQKWRWIALNQLLELRNNRNENSVIFGREDKTQLPPYITFYQVEREFLFLSINQHQYQLGKTILYELWVYSRHQIHQYANQISGTLCSLIEAQWLPHLFQLWFERWNKPPIYQDTKLNDKPDFSFHVGSVEESTSWIIGFFKYINAYPCDYLCANEIITRPTSYIYLMHTCSELRRKVSVVFSSIARIAMRFNKNFTESILSILNE